MSVCGANSTTQLGFAFARLIVTEYSLDMISPFIEKLTLNDTLALL